MKEEQISDILYNALANMKEYMPDGFVSENFTAIPNVRIAPLAKQLHKAFIQAQIEMLNRLMNCAHADDEEGLDLSVGYILSEINILTKLLEDE